MMCGFRKLFKRKESKLSKEQKKIAYDLARCGVEIDDIDAVAIKLSDLALELSIFYSISFKDACKSMIKSIVEFETFESKEGGG